MTEQKMNWIDIIFTTTCFFNMSSTTVQQEMIPPTRSLNYKIKPTPSK